MATTTVTEDEEEYCITNEETLHLCFPLPPTHCFRKYVESVNNGREPLPPKTVSGTYSVFGDICDTNEEIIRPLEAQGIPQLFSTEDDYDILSEMKKINHSILVNFLELLDTLIDSSLQHERELKLEDMNLLFINLHHLINEFRPHQARETLRVMLQRQKEEKYNTAEKLNRHIEKVKVILRNCQSNLCNRPFSSAKHSAEQQNEYSASGKGAMELGKEDITFKELDKRSMCDLVDMIN